MTISKRVLYQGNVQGVGFRYTTLGVVQGFAVTGFVRNLPGGQVEVVAEGEGDEVERFLAALLRRMAAYVEGHTIHDEPPHGFAGFSIER